MAVALGPVGSLSDLPVGKPRRPRHGRSGPPLTMTTRSSRGARWRHPALGLSPAL